MEINYRQINLAVALLLDGQPDAAVSAWNAAGVAPQLARVRYDVDKDMLRLTTAAGQVAEMGLDDLLVMLMAPEANAAKAG